MKVAIHGGLDVEDEASEEELGYDHGQEAVCGKRIAHDDDGRTEPPHFAPERHGGRHSSGVFESYAREFPEEALKCGEGRGVAEDAGLQGFVVLGMPLPQDQERHAMPRFLKGLDYKVLVRVIPRSRVDELHVLWSGAGDSVRRPLPHIIP